MKKIIKVPLVVIIMLIMIQIGKCETAVTSSSADKSKTGQTAVAKEAQQNYTVLKSPTLIVQSPYLYLDKYVEFTAKFNKFSTLGLDYKPAMRESRMYIGILIERDDVGSYVIPLSELKMFIKRTEAEKYTDLNSGDRILIKGKVFSTALGDPWMDITEMKILTPKNKEEKAK